MPQPEEHASMLDLFKDTACQREAINDFLTWLRKERGVELARWNEYYGDRLDPANVVLDEVIAEFLGIDLNQLEAERRALLE